MLSRRQVARSVAARLLAGDDSAAVLRQLAAYLVVNRLQKQLAMYVGDIEYELAQAGTVVANVTSARTLTPDLRQRLIDYVQAETSARRVVLEESIDPAIIGGVIVRTPTLTLDASVTTKLKRLRTS